MAKKKAGRKPLPGTKRGHSPQLIIRAPNKPAYERAASSAGKELSDWVRETLDRAVAS